VANHSTELAGKRDVEAVKSKRVLWHYFLQWLVLTSVASAFFIIAPRIAVHGSGNYPPILVAILFPAIVIGLAFAFQYLIRRRTNGITRQRQ